MCAGAAATPSLSTKKVYLYDAFVGQESVSQFAAYRKTQTELSYGLRHI